MPRFLEVQDKKIEIKWIQPHIEHKPCLVFLHEGLGCTQMWKDFPLKLSFSTGCPALVFSRAGYGRSDPQPLPWKINFMHTQALQFLPQFIKASGIKEYILIGHSDGGSVGIIFAGSPYAKGLKGLITEAAHVFCEKLSVDSIFQAKINYESGSLKQGLEKYHGKNTDNAFWGWNDVWLNPQFMKWNIEKYLNRIKVPMLALQGKNDQYGSSGQIESIHKHVKRVETHLLDNCRHTPHFEQPEITLELMSGFIKSMPC